MANILGKSKSDGIRCTLLRPRSPLCLLSVFSWDSCWGGGVLLPEEEEKPERGAEDAGGKEGASAYDIARHLNPTGRGNCRGLRGRAARGGGIP